MSYLELSSTYTAAPHHNITLCEEKRMDFSLVPVTMKTAMFWFTLPMLALLSALLFTMIYHSFKSIRN